MNKIALITGINGQDGSYLAEFLLEKGYDVHGVVRRTSQFNRGRIEQTREKAIHNGQVFNLVYGDMGSPGSFNKYIYKYNPTEIYNLASQSHVAISFEEPEYSTEVNGNSVLRLLESMRYLKTECRLFQASTSELFGIPTVSPQDENTPFHPVSPYGVSKLFAYWMIRTYRDAYGMHANNGILYNHESPRRGENFVTRKITYSLARIRHGMQQVLELGNINAERDWGFAGDYVKAMWLILQQEKPDDYVIATGIKHTVRDFVERAAEVAGFSIDWEGRGVNEIGIDRISGKTIVKINPAFYRPIEPGDLYGNANKAFTTLNWKPEVSFETLVQLMMESDLDAVVHGDRR